MSPASSTSEQWSTRRLLDWMSGALARAGVESARLCAEMLVAHVLACERMRLYMEPDRPASPAELDRLRDLTARALRNEPVQYLVGEAWFFSLPFAVDARVLIPRPCTEGMVEEIVQRARRRPSVEHAAEQADPPAPEPPMRILDLCTGSGCIAVALARSLPGASVVATDISSDALAVARANAERHAVAQRIDFRRGDLWQAVRDGEVFDYVAANPPYIPDSEWDVPGMMGANVKGQEPDVALRGGPDGLDALRPIVQGAGARLAAGGVLIVETAASTAGRVLELARAQPDLGAARVINDHEGHPRFIMAQKRASGGP